MTVKRPNDMQLGMPSSEALRLAANSIRRRYVSPETMLHPAVKSECLRLAYFIQAYALVPMPSPEPTSRKHIEGGSKRRRSPVWTAMQSGTNCSRVHPVGEKAREPSSISSYPGTSEWRLAAPYLGEPVPNITIGR